MKQYKYFLELTFPKTIDVTLAKDEDLTHRKFSNNLTGMDELMKWLTELNLNVDDVLFCMEATGLYCFPLTQFLSKNEIDIWIEHAAQIKRLLLWTEGKMTRLILSGLLCTL